jgi:hypothetical protein
VYRGEWDAEVPYSANDVVTQDGSSFVALRETIGVAPAGSTNSVNLDWALFASKGDTGAAGTAGSPGTAGADGAPGLPGAAGPAGAQGPAGPSGTTGQGALSVVSTGSAVLTNNMLTDVPGLSVGVNVSASTSAVLVSSDGGVQVNSNTSGQAVVVDIYLFVDGDVTPKQIVQRRIYAVNNVVVPNVANWSFAVAVTGLTPGVAHTFRVSASLVITNGSAAVVSGSSGSNAHLRGTLTAVVINK